MQTFQTDVAVQSHFVPVIETGAFQRPVVHPEARHADDMKRRERGGAKARDVAGVGRYLRFVQRDMKHACTLRNVVESFKPVRSGTSEPAG